MAAVKLLRHPSHDWLIFRNWIKAEITKKKTRKSFLLWEEVLKLLPPHSLFLKGQSIRIWFHFSKALCRVFLFNLNTVSLVYIVQCIKPLYRNLFMINFWLTKNNRKLTLFLTSEKMEKIYIWLRSSPSFTRAPETDTPQPGLEPWPPLW
jgi:hypothetical protein